MNKIMNPYEILGLQSSASEIEVKKAYRDLARKCHPDKGGTEDKFKEINEAYTQIINGSPMEAFPELDELFNLFASGFGNIKMFNPQGPTIVTKLELSLEQLEIGGQFTVKYKRNVPTGKYINSISMTPFGIMNVTSPEEIEKVFETLIDIPKCCDHRKQLVFPRLAKADHLPSGNLEVIIILIKHPIFTRISGSLDLQTELSISLKESLIGFSRDIKILNSEETVKIECETIVNPYDTKRISSYGMKYDENIYGDLLIKFKIQFPVLLSEETVNIIKNLNEL